MKSPEYLAALKAELQTPQYAGKSHDDIERLLIDPTRDVDNSVVAGDQLFDLLDVDEYLSVTDAAKRAVLTDLLRHGIKPNSPSGRKVLAYLFGVGSKTDKNLDKLKKRKGSRWEEIGLPSPPNTSDIADALR